MITRRRGSRLLALLVAGLAAVLLGACGAAPGINGGGGGEGIREVNPYGGDLAAEGEPRRGGVLVMGTDREAIGFDPTKQNTNMAALAVFDSLMKLRPDGTAEPYLARSMDTPDAGRTWTMGLRPGVRFSDGTPLDAEAVIFNVQRHIDTPSSPGNRFATQIASMRAVDPTTVEFTLKAPFGAFPIVFAQSFTTGNLGSMLSPAAVRKEGAQIANRPVGAGPFVLTEWTRDSKMVLTRNPNYWQEGKPYLDGLEFRPLPDTESRYASIENGDVDLIFGGYHTELLRGLGNPNRTVYYGPGNGAEYLYFNHKIAPFDDRRMREAVVRGLDLNALAATQFRGQMERADEWFGASSPYRSQEAAAAWPAFDQERARQLVREYVAAGGNATISYKTTNAPNRVAFAEFLQAQMAAIGITLQPQFFDLAQYSSSVVQARDFQVAGWVGGPYDAPFPLLGNLFASKGNTNYGNYANPEVDALVQTAAATTDEAERARAYQRISLLTNQDIAVGYYSRGYLSTITKPEVKGMVRYLTRDMFFATTWKQQP
ncbi:ABC transporter substrate-binding protein [Pseudonocardia endophytica]|uniref:Peptide/nickel transport system substrate-binding protein n=1 Tax=Pseudonocardia endophytica TaxID=401976 RepID=A0A4R1HIZ3_PSEEN|nr:ABC transporter substrate-binding protein [Pseudonocardia endophytica]TCK22237.1 peptide/nickel transport system substrate-binding protein [Pseudonocardia endophytica]